MNEQKQQPGVEKVEAIVRRRREQGAPAAERGAGAKKSARAEEEARKAMQGAAAAGGGSAAKKRKARGQAKAAEAREQARADKRVAAAQKRKEEKQAKARRKAERAEEKRRAAAERKAEERERARQRHAAAEERAAHKRAARAQRKTERSGQSGRRAPGFGGWLAAVVSLSVAVLALGAIVTVGYFDLSAAKGELASGYRASAYGFSEAVEELGSDLGKARIAGGGELQRLLADVYAGSLAAEQCVGALPADAQQTAALSACINRTGGFAKQALAKLSEGGTLSAEDMRQLSALYEEIGTVRAAMPAVIGRASEEGAAEGIAKGSPPSLKSSRAALPRCTPKRARRRRIRSRAKRR